MFDFEFNYKKGKNGEILGYVSVDLLNYFDLQDKCNVLFRSGHDSESLNIDTSGSLISNIKNTHDSVCSSFMVFKLYENENGILERKILSYKTTLYSSSLRNKLSKSLGHNKSEKHESEELSSSEQGSESEEYEEKPRSKSRMSV